MINLVWVKNQEKHIQHTEKLIEKFRAKASKAAMAQSLNMYVLSDCVMVVNCT